jgi:DNA-binding response OmpR family regulator
MSKVLIIDDDASMRAMLRETLSLSGYEVDTAEDGRKAKELYDKNDYQAVITDIIMPEQDGFEVILDFRSRNQTNRLIAISGGGRTSADDYLLTAEHFGVAAIFPKPVNRKALLAKIAEMTAV